MLAALFGQAVLGWLLADLITGTFHWWEDRYGVETWPIVGPWIVTPNRLHHAEPLAFAENGFLDRNLAAIVAASTVGAAWWFFRGPSVFSAATLIGSGLANEVHFYAHKPSAAGSVLRVLQQTGAIQSPKVHALHHRPPNTANYCVLTDWLNPALEALQIWPRLERIFGPVRA
jgi:hypothetical protein